MPRESKTKADLTEAELQQLQVALKIPSMGGTQRISRPQKAHTTRSSFIRKSILSFVEHLQAKSAKVPRNECDSPLTTCSRGVGLVCWTAALCAINIHK